MVLFGILELSIVLVAVQNGFTLLFAMDSSKQVPETPQEWTTFEPIRPPIETSMPSTDSLAGYKLDSIGSRISIDGIPAPYFLSELRNQQYACMRLLQTDINPLLEPNKFTNEEKIERAYKFQDKLINCTPFFNDLIERSLQNLGLIGKFIRIWIRAMDKFLKRARISGYKGMMDTTNIRYLPILNETLRLTMQQPYKFDRTIFGSMAFDEEGELDEYLLTEYHLARAYYAGDGFCNHISSAPFTTIANLVKQSIVLGKVMAKQVHDPDGTLLAQFNPLREHFMKSNQPELIIIIQSIHHVCLSFKENPSPQLMGYLKQLTPLLKHTPRSAIPTLLTTVNSQIVEIVGDLTEQKLSEEQMQDKKMRYNREDDICSWLTLFKLKKLAQASLSAEETAAFFLSRQRSLGANTFLEICLNKLLTKFRENHQLELWPKEFEDKMILEQIVRRLEVEPKLMGYGSRLLDLINSRDFATLSEYDNILLHNYGNYYNSMFDANKKQIINYASGSGSLCDFYTKYNLGKGEIYHIIELIYATFDIVEFKPKISNDATAFFYWWRICSLNSLMPIYLEPVVNTAEIAKTMDS